MLSYPGSTRSRRRKRDLKPRNKNQRLTASITRLPKKRHSRSRERRNGARTSVAQKRSPERKEGKGGSRQSQMPQLRLNKRVGPTKLRSKGSIKIAPLLTSGHLQRTCAGQGRRRNWRQHCAGHTISGDFCLSG